MVYSCVDYIYCVIHYVPGIESLNLLQSFTAFIQFPFPHALPLVTINLISFSEFVFKV